jgi:hypothetical protein
MNIDGVAVFLVALPGYAALFFRNKIALEKSSKRPSPIKESLKCLLNGFPITAISLLAIHLLWRVKTIGGLKAASDSIPTLLAWLAVMIAATVAYGAAWGMGARVWAKAEARLADKVTGGGGYYQYGKGAWEIFMSSKNRARYVKVIAGGVESSGYIQKCSFGEGEDLELILEKPEECEIYPALRRELEKARIDEVYVNAEKGIIIESYDTAGVDRAGQAIIDSRESA